MTLCLTSALHVHKMHSRENISFRVSGGIELEKQNAEVTKENFFCFIWSQLNCLSQLVTEEIDNN